MPCFPRVSLALLLLVLQICPTVHSGVCAGAHLQNWVTHADLILSVTTFPATPHLDPNMWCPSLPSLVALQQSPHYGLILLFVHVCECMCVWVHVCVYTPANLGGHWDNLNIGRLFHFGTEQGRAS